VHASASSTQCLMNCQRRLSSSSSSTTPPFSKQALRHCFSLVHTGASSTQCVTNNRRRRQQSYPHSSSSPILLFSKKLSDTASTQCAPATPTERLASNCDRHHQPGLVAFENCFRFEDPSRRQQPSCSTAKRHEAKAASDLKISKSPPAAKLFDNEET